MFITFHNQIVQFFRIVNLFVNKHLFKTYNTDILPLNTVKNSLLIIKLKHYLILFNIDTI